MKKIITPSEMRNYLRSEPVLSAASDALLKKIQSMEPHTAYILLAGHLAPLLQQASKKSYLQLEKVNTKIDILHSPMRSVSQSSHATVGPAERAHRTLQQLKNDFSRIQTRLKDLYEKRQEIIDQWIDSTESNPIKPDNQLLKDLYYLRENLQKDFDQIKDRIAQFEEDMPGSKDKDKLIERLQKNCEDLESKIPEPKTTFDKNSGHWKVIGDTLIDKKGNNHGMRFWWKENEGDKAKLMKWEDSGDTKLPKNPLGIFEMVIDKDRSKYKDFLGTLSKGIDNINEFYKTTGSKSLHVFLLQGMDTETAYMYMIVVLLPLLQNQAAEGLENHGNNMKQISKVFDLWNEIQNEINKVAKNSKQIHQWIKEGKVDSNYNLYKDNTYKEKETDSNKLSIWNPFKGLISNLENRANKLQNMLTQMGKDLPDSMKSLLDTMKTLTTKILDIPINQEARDLSSFLQVLEKSREEKAISRDIEILTKTKEDLLKKKEDDKKQMKQYREQVSDAFWNMPDWMLKEFGDYRYNYKKAWNRLKDRISEYDKSIDEADQNITLKEAELRQKEKERVAKPDKRLTILSWMINSDQTEFKTYVDNLGQGITALTSISNMTQQLLQIDTQYFNSLLGLQKAGQDTVNKTIQSIINNMR